VFNAVPAALLPDPANPGRLWLAAPQVVGEDGVERHAGGVYFSDDAGETFASAGLRHGAPYLLARDTATGRLYAAERNLGLLWLDVQTP
jgi:hypothetical protein